MMESLTAAMEENNRKRLGRSSHPEGWAWYSTTLKGSSGESDRETLPHAALDGERLHRDRGAEQPRPYARRERRGGAEHAQTGEGGVGIHLADGRARAEQGIRLAEADPALAGELPGLSGVDQQRDGEGTRQRRVGPRPGHARRELRQMHRAPRCAAGSRGGKDK